MHLRLALNLLHFLQDLSALYALRRTPNFFEIHPRLEITQALNNKLRAMTWCLIHKAHLGEIPSFRKISDIKNNTIKDNL
jgi:hypothetical protein